MVHKCVCADFDTNLLGRTIVAGNEFCRCRHINTVDIRITNRRSSGSDEDFLRTALASHANNFLNCRSANDGVIHQQNILILKLNRHGVQFLANALLSYSLAGHDEGAADVAVLDEAFAVRKIQSLG